jgi:hypothetical protein
MNTPISATLPRAPITQSPAHARFGIGANDRLMVIGSALCGTMILGIIGVPILAYVLLQERAATRAGTSLRPLSVTLIGLLCFQDGFENLLSYSLDTWASHTIMGKTFLVNGYGRHFDVAWVRGYNQGLVPGVQNTAEKVWQLVCIFVLFPLRVCATWGFLQMKTWGLHFLRTTTWMYLLVWIGYLLTITIDSSWRMSGSDTGVIGWWVFNFPYTLVPPLVLAYLYTIDERRWNR